MLLHDVFRGGRLSSSGLENSLVSMDRDFADAELLAELEGSGQTRH